MQACSVPNCSFFLLGGYQRPRPNYKIRLSSFKIRFVRRYNVKIRLQRDHDCIHSELGNSFIQISLTRIARRERRDNEYLHELDIDNLRFE